MSHRGGKGRRRGFWEKQADSFVLIHYIQGKWRVSSYFYFYKLGARVILWIDEAAMFSSHLETLQFRLYLLGLRIFPRVWQLFIAGLSQSLTRGDNEFGKEPCLSSFHSIYFCFTAPCGWLNEGLKCILVLMVYEIKYREDYLAYNSMSRPCCKRMTNL